MRRPPRAEPEAARQEVRLEDRLEHDLQRGLHDTVADSRDRQRPLLIRSRLQMNPRRAGNGRYRILPAVPRPARRAAGRPRTPRRPPALTRSMPAAPRLRRTSSHALSSTSLRWTLSNSAWNRRAGIGLGRPVKRMLEAALDSVPADSRQGGPSRHRTGTHQPEASPLAHERSSGPSLPAGCTVLRIDRYYDRLRLPPGRRPLPGSTPVIGPRFPRLSAGRFVRGGPLQFPPPPSERSAPSYAGESLAAAYQDLHRFHGLRREPPGSALSSVSNDAAGFACAADRSVAPPQRAFDAGLRPGQFPGQAASLLPGSLAITRTGLPPAGDDELPTRS